MSDDLYDGPCEAGCQHFHGGEVEHHKDCGHYPHSLTKMNADRIEELEAKLAKAVEALTPSGDTKAEYMGEFRFPITLYHPKLGEETRTVSVPWTCIKEVMAMIRARAAMQN